MEGYNPSLNCYLTCESCFKGWVPNPRGNFPRRNPLVDAYARTENPCERPARCPPDCEPFPKFLPPRELPVCNICDFEEEKMEAKEKEEAECREKYDKWEKSFTPYIEIKNLSPDKDLNLEMDVSTGKKRYVLVDQPVRTNIIAGIFNPDDNKTHDQRMREKCDESWIPCSCGFPPYPSRGVINYPRQKVVDTMSPTSNPECEGTKYVDPEYIKEQEERRQYDNKEKCTADAEPTCYEPGRKTRNPPDCNAVKYKCL